MPGGVAFSGDWGTCYGVNLWSRIASRVLWQVSQFDYRDEKDLYEATRALDWQKYFPVERTLRVNVTALKSPLKSLEFVTLRIKDAVCDRFRDELGRRPERRPHAARRAHPRFSRGRARARSISIPPASRCSSAAGAARRGEAPLRENLAAGIVMLSGWQPGEPLLDPMCGGGTLLVEAAAMARGRAPGAKRSFGFEKLQGLRRRGPGRASRNEASRAGAAP